MIKKILCWWFGHDPVAPELSGQDHNHTPCGRCGIWDIGYHDLVMPSRYEWCKEELKYWFYFKWIAIRFKRTSDSVDDEEIPF